MDNKEIIFKVNNITYRTEYRGELNSVVIEDIDLTGNVYIPGIVSYNNKAYYIKGFKTDIFNNILNKNITYFSVDEEINQMVSINGIIYFKIKSGRFTELLLVLVPPKLNINILKLPTNHEIDLRIDYLCTNKNLKTIIIDNNENINIHDYSYFCDFPSSTIKNIIIKNKHLEKVNDKWKLIKNNVYN